MQTSTRSIIETTTTIGAGLVVLAWLACPAAAHERSLHKGKSIDGEIATVSADRLSLQTDRGRLTIALTGDTTITRGRGVTSKQDLRPGDHVSVFGTTLATGEVVAREIVVQGGTHDGGHPAATSPSP